MNCNDFEELSGAYALGAISQEERQLADAHLAHCPACQQMLQSLQSVVDLLPLSVPAVEPAPQVKERILSTIRADAPGKRIHALRPAQAHSPARWSLRLVAVAAALFFVLAGGMAIWNISLQQQIAHISANNSLHSIAYSLRGAASASGVTGQLTYYPELHMTILTVHGLPALTGDHVYQGWLIEGQHPKSVGVLNVQADTATLNFPGDVSGYDTTAVSLEQGPQASAAPHGQIIASGLLKSSSS